MESTHVVEFIVQLLDALPAWAIFIAVVVGLAILALIVGAGYFLVAYFKQKGALQAQAESIENLTKTVKSIESDFDYRSWHAKEENSLRRQKLEEMLAAAHAYCSWVESHGTTCVYFEERPSSATHDAIVSSHAVLYFPELGDAVKAFMGSAMSAVAAHKEIRHSRIVRFQMLPNEQKEVFRKSIGALAPPTDEEREIEKATYIAAYKSLLALRKACGDLMQLLRPEPKQRNGT